MSRVPATVPSVSVVVPGLNGAATLGAALAALRAQRWPPGEHEIVYADCGSSDGSRELAARWADRVVTVPGRPSAGAARNAGAAAARGDVLVFVDCDVVAPADTVARLLAVLAGDAGVAAVFGSYDAAPAHPTLVSRFRNLLHHHVHQRSQPEAATFWAGCGAVRRDAFERAGGFDARSRIEDVELGRRLRAAGLRIRLERDIQVRHLKSWTLGGMLRTDLLLRGIPWCLLLLEGGTRPRELGTLNLTAGGVASTALAWTAVASALAGPPPWGWAIAILALAGALALDLPFHRLLQRLHGTGFALACVPLLLLHHLGNGLAAVAAVAYWLLARVTPRLARAARSGAARLLPPRAASPGRG
jgi:hypothetical protein